MQVQQLGCRRYARREPGEEESMASRVMRTLAARYAITATASSCIAPSVHALVGWPWHPTSGCG